MKIISAVSATAPISISDKMMGKDKAQHTSVRMTFAEPRTDKKYSPKSVGNRTAEHGRVQQRKYGYLLNAVAVFACIFVCTHIC